MKLLLKDIYILVLAARSGGGSTEPCRESGSHMAHAKPEGCCHGSAERVGN